MVMEHIPDGKKAYSNIFNLLDKGGVAISYFPTLYSPPFVINKLLPEALSSKILRFFFPQRNQEEIPKFPAYYSWCKGRQRKMSQKLTSLGFEEALILPFYGNNYFHKIPIMRELDALFTSVSKKWNWDFFSSYAFSLVRK